MTRALVTGASGFVGANLARRLLRDGHEVHLLLRHAQIPWRLTEIQAEVHRHSVDLEDRDAVAAAVAAIRPERVFHLAAYGAYSSQSDIHRMVQTNIAGTVNLVEACLVSGCAVIVNTGSSSEYGFADHAPAETERVEPNSHYAVTKVAATQYCRYTARQRDLHLPTLRLYSVYGPYEEPSRLMPTLIARGLRGELPPLVDPTIARDYVYIDDVCDAYLLAATRPSSEPGAIYNVGTGVQTSLAELVTLSRAILPITVVPVWGSMPNRQWDTTVWVADSRKIHDELGWQPRHTLEQGFRRMVDWFQTHPELLAFYQRRLSASP
jgi:dolichol-phosphate mannosyltransferase